jgi:hypothetical protein
MILAYHTVRFTKPHFMKNFILVLGMALLVSPSLLCKKGNDNPDNEEPPGRCRNKGQRDCKAT